MKIPESVQIHIIDSEESVELLGLLDKTSKDDEPLGIDSEWRPSMNVFHKA